MTVAGIITLLIVVIFALFGMRKGLVRKLSGVLSVVIAALLVNQMLPYVTRMIREQTPAYDYISAQCGKILEEKLISAAIPSGGENADNGLSADQIRSLLLQYGIVDPSVAESLSDSDLQSYAREYLQENTEQVTQMAAGALDTLSKVEQTELIKSLPVPGFVQKMMINFNNSEGYSRLGVTDFSHYLTGFIANIILNIASFLVTMLLTWLIVRGILGALNLFSRLPLVGFVDRTGGLIAGAIEGLFVVWLLFLIVSLFSGTKQGMAVQDMISESFVLEPFYENNVFLKIVSGAMQKIF